MIIGHRDSILNVKTEVRQSTWMNPCFRKNTLKKKEMAQNRVFGLLKKIKLLVFVLKWVK